MLVIAAALFSLLITKIIKVPQSIGSGKLKLSHSGTGLIGVFLW
ncbi:MAG: hypothetical protein OFPI_01220 [Osedax symbiont Rs2]|nr:MAG: hypothetical protein OFPI_01220 [Osedax symbiont Rs2]